jgi:hypothetical protein
LMMVKETEICSVTAMVNWFTCFSAWFLSLYYIIVKFYICCVTEKVI